MSAAALIADCQKRLERARGGGGWFTSGGSTVDHGTYRSVIAPYHDRVYYEGRVTWGALVQANPGLYTRGDWDSTGAVVFSFDRYFDANPQALERMAASVGALKNAMPKDALLVAFAAEVRNDAPREIDRMVPVALTAGRQVRYETIYIQRHRLPTGYLAGQFFPIIISTSQPTQPMLLPLDEWTPELVEMWKLAARKKPPAPQTIARESQPISRTPQAYDDGYGGLTGGMNGGMSGGNGNTPAGGAGLQFSSNAPNRASAAAYGGNSSRFEPSTGYSGGNNSSYANTSSGYGNGNGNSYPAPPPPPPVNSPSPAAGYATPNAYAAPIGYSGQGFASVIPPMVPTSPAPAPAPRLDPAAEAFAQKPLQLTPAAAGSLKLSAGQQAPGQPSSSKLKVRVSLADSVHRLDFVTGEPNPTTDFVYDSGGVTLVVDLNSARNLTGVQVDFGPTPQGIGFVFRRVA